MNGLIWENIIIDDSNTSVVCADRIGQCEGCRDGFWGELLIVADLCDDTAPGRLCIVKGICSGSCERLRCRGGEEG